MSHHVEDANGTARCFVDDLVAKLAQNHAHTDTANPLSHADLETKNTLLTLHALFPNELLPALDLLDRGLVLRLLVLNEAGKDELVESERLGSDTATAQLEEGQQLTNAKQERVDAAGETLSGLYFVRSAQQHARPKWRDAVEQAVHYEVRLNAWNCSCPAFAFVVFPAAPSTGTRTKINQTTRFGGKTLGDDLPICKHLLACFLADQCQMFHASIEERTVSKNEAIAWAAGWCD